MTIKLQVTIIALIIEGSKRDPICAVHCVSSSMKYGIFFIRAHNVKYGGWLAGMRPEGGKSLQAYN